MKNKYSLIFIITGTALILSALFLCIYNVVEDRKSGENAEIMLNNLKNEITVEQTEPFTEEFFEAIIGMETSTEAEMRSEAEIAAEAPVKDVDGISFIGYLTMPTINLELAVMSNWSYEKLDISPCRYYGSAETKNLVIAAHNFSSHFRNIDGIYSGDLFYFTDVNGKIYEYQAMSVEQISGNDVDTMLKDKDDSWDITLFTCTLDGRNRVTVRGKLTEE